jgi:hypothetical protein
MLRPVRSTDACDPHPDQAGDTTKRCSRASVQTHRAPSAAAGAELVQPSVAVLEERCEHPGEQSCQAGDVHTWFEGDRFGDNVFPASPTLNTARSAILTRSRCRSGVSAMIFLASDEARYITGVTFPVDAGYNNRTRVRAGSGTRRLQRGIERGLLIHRFLVVLQRSIGGYRLPMSASLRISCVAGKHVSRPQSSTPRRGDAELMSQSR